ncbi:FAD-dependent monooxygenase [Paractinoplanes lichenicola]|uniref:FAD-dependent monooxygenase n=1 Tax=Paractinoplanes lichenicola TaxID=2802976 RepID=A0ABS1VZT6_9ACTN|nr:FAD-dependent monooxygenase [Actinoplanes lichenicola]MBL7260002.1 FAD-dependent monooxygenase [Actinoplanes lichenicola]
MRTVLISGAGVAGTTLAYWLAERGWQPTIVELSGGLRSSGNPVDVRGPAVAVAERMGVMGRLHDARTQATSLRLIDEQGQTRARVRAPSGTEIPRADLARILFEAARDRTELILGDTVTALTPGAAGVEVTFARSAPRRFDLVVGADGLHSAVRRIAFGPESDFVDHQGLYVATLPLGQPARAPHEVQLLNAPGRLLSVHPGRGQELAAFIFRHPEAEAPDPVELVVSAYGEMGWRAPELLDRLRAATDFYFDAVSRVRVPAWTRGRVTLLGDAATCVSLFGDGSTMAMAGAFTLADALGRLPIEAALRSYEARHRRLVQPKQHAVGATSHLLVPTTRWGIGLRNAGARLLQPAA